MPGQNSYDDFLAKLNALGLGSSNGSPLPNAPQYSSMDQMPASFEPPQSTPVESAEEEPKAPPLSLLGAQNAAVMGATNIQGPDTLIQAQGPKPSSAMDLYSPEALAGAQEDARKRSLGVGVLGSISDAISTMTGTRPDTETWKQLQAQAQSPLTTLEQQQKNASNKMAMEKGQIELTEEKQMADVNSPMAKAYKDFAQKSLTKYIPADALEKMSPQQISSLVKNVSPIIDAQIRRDAVNATKSLSMSTKQEADLDKAEEKLKQALAFDSKSSRSAIGKVPIIRNTAERILPAFEQYRDAKGNINFDQIPKERLFEIARQADSMISQTGGTQSGSMELMPPPGALQSAADFKRWFTQDLSGAKQGAWAKNMYELVQRERDVSNAQANDEIEKQFKLESGGKLGKYRPERLAELKSIYLGANQSRTAPHVGGAAQDKPFSDAQKESRYQELLKKKQERTLQ